MDSIVWIFLFTAIFSEFYLLYLNYLARVRYKKYFVELNPTWRWFDKRGKTHVALLLGFLISFFIIIFLGITELHIFLGFMVGIISTNTVFDDMTFRRRYLCIKFQCTKLEEVRKCTECELQEQYSVSPIFLIVEKKKEVGYKQKYDHIIGFFKWLLSKIFFWRRKSG